MSLALGLVLWAAIGVLAGGSAIWVFGVRAPQGAVVYGLAGALGALVGGATAHALFQQSAAHPGALATAGVALLGAWVVILLLKMTVGGRHLAH